MPTAQEYTNWIIVTAIKQGAPEVNAKLIAAQAAHETANFTSNNFRKNNNAFGMAIPRVRKSPYILPGCTVTAPTGEGSFCYARYASVEDSVKDLVHWLHYNKVDWRTVTTPESYDAFLVKKGFHTASQSSYTAALKRFFEPIKNLVVKYPKASIVVVIGSAALIAGGVYLLFIKKKKVA